MREGKRKKVTSEVGKEKQRNAQAMKTRKVGPEEKKKTSHQNLLEVSGLKCRRGVILHTGFLVTQ